MKSESIKFTVGKFTGGKLLLALVGLMLLGVVSTQAKAEHGQTPVDTGETLALTQGDITFTVGVETTHTLNAATGGVTPYEDYTLRKLVNFRREPIRAAALVFDGTVASRELRSTTSIVASDAGTYRITIVDHDTSETADSFEIVVLAAPPAISFVNTPTGQIAEGGVIARYVGQETLDVILPDTDPKSGTGSTGISGISQLMYMNGCPVTDSSAVDLRAFGTTGDTDTTCTQTPFRTRWWSWTGQYNTATGSISINDYSNSEPHQVEAAWANDLKAVAFSYEVTYSGDVIARNFTYVFYNKPTIAVQTNVSWNGDATAFVATFSPGADGYRGGTFNGVFTIDGGALTYGVGLANTADTALPGIGIEVQTDGTPVLTATAYTAASVAAYAATSYELTVGDLAGNIAMTTFTLAVTEKAPPAFAGTQGPFTFTAGYAGTKALTPATNATGGHTLAKVGGSLAALSINAAGNILTATSAIAAGDAGMYEITASDASNNMARTTFTVVVVSAPTFPLGANPGNQTVADGATGVSITLGNAIGGTPPVTYGLTARGTSVNNGGTIGGLVYTAASGGTAATISGTVSTIAADSVIVYTAGDANGATTQFSFVFNPSLPSFGSPQGPFTFTAGHAGTKVLTPATNAPGGHTLAKLSGSLAALSINTAGDLLTATQAIAAGDAGMYEITASDASNNMARTTFTVVVVSAPTFPLGANPGNQTVADGETNVSITLGNAIGGTPPVTYGLTANGTAVNNGGTIGGLVYTAASGGTAATISGTVSTIAADSVIVYTAGDANGATTQFSFVFNPSLPSFGSPQGPFTFTAGHAGTKVLTPATNAPGGHTLAKLSGSLAALSINTAGDLLTATQAIAAGDAGMYEITASDAANNMVKTTFAVAVVAALEFPPGANPGNRVAQLGDTLDFNIGNAVGGLAPLEYFFSGGGSSPSNGDDIYSSSPGFEVGLRYNTASGSTPARISGTVTRVPADFAKDFLIEYSVTDANGAEVIMTFYLNPSAPAIVPTLAQEDLFFFTDATITNYTLSEAVSEDEDAIFTYALAGSGVALASEFDEDNETTLFVFDPETRELRNTTFATATYSANYTLSVVDTIDSRATASSRFNINVIERPVTTDETYAAVEAEFLPDVGAAVAAETVLAIGERVGQVRARGFGAPYVSIGEQSTIGGFISQHAKPLVDKSIEPKQLLKGAHLSLPLFSNGAFSWIPPMGIWLAIEGRAMSNETDEVKWDGTLGGAYLGIDARVGDSIVGVASATSKSTIDYEDLNPAVGADAIKGEYDLSLSSINPYISWQNGNSDWWITLGEGEGELTRNPDKVDEITTDLVLKSVAFGVSRALNQQERRKTRLSASLQAARLEVEGKAGKNLLDPGFVAETYKGGLGKVAAEVDLSRTLRGGSTLSPFYQAAALYDYGDNDNGVGMETVGGIRWLSTKRGSGGEMQVRWAAAGDYEEWGAYAQWRLQSGADGQGVSASLRPGYGDSDSADILQNGLPTALIDGADYELHLDARVGFGLTGARGLVTPFAEWLHREDEVYRLGVDWLPSKLFEANLTGEQYTDEKRVWLKGEVKF